MIFAKVDVGLPRHHRFLRIPKPLRAAAIGVWTTALCYTRSEQLDGFCPLEAIEAIASTEVIDALVQVGLFARQNIDGVEGFEVLKYAEHNDTKADIQTRLESDRKRKSYRRPDGGSGSESGGSPTGGGQDSDRNPSGSVSTEGAGIPGSGSLSDSPSPRSRAVQNATDDGAFGLAVTAWREGVTSVTGRPFDIGPPGNMKALVSAIAMHAPSNRDRVDWARRGGAAWARASIAGGSPLISLRFGDWLNAGAPKSFGKSGKPSPEPPSPTHRRLDV